MGSNMQQLINAFEQLNTPRNEETLFKFERYMEGILLWNQKVNLTAITEREAFIQNHFVDSILCAGYPEVQNAETIIDVGTGAGFPGVPLALLFPEKQFVLIDSLQKRIKIIHSLLKEIGIENVAAIHGRAEDLASDAAYRERFDLCVSRAVAKMPTLAEYCLPFVKKGGFFLAYKSEGTEEERVMSKNALNRLGGGTPKERAPAIEGFDLKHIFLFIEKTAGTPERYPRKAGLPSKNPLR